MIVYQAKWKHWSMIQWRDLTWAEHKQFANKYRTQSPRCVNNDIYRTCVLIGPDIEDITAGIVDYIAVHSFNNSIFTNAHDVVLPRLEEARQRVGDNFLLRSQAIIAAIFKYSFEEIETWDPTTFLDRLIAAEGIAGRTMDLVRDEPRIEKTTKSLPPNKKPPTAAQQIAIDRSRRK